jgi:hypothetical protein
MTGYAHPLSRRIRSGADGAGGWEQTHRAVGAMVELRIFRVDRERVPAHRHSAARRARALRGCSVARSHEHRVGTGMETDARAEGACATAQEGRLRRRLFGQMARDAEIGTADAAAT